MKITGKPTGRGILKQDGEGNILTTGHVKQLDKNIKKIMDIRPAKNAKILKMYHEYKAEQRGEEVASFNLL